MKTLDIARKLAEAGEKEEASKAYELVLQENNGSNNDIDLEAAVYLLYQEGDYRIPVTTLVNLHKKDYMKTDIVGLLFSILWQPNFSIYKENYRKNIAKLKNYKYIFKKSDSFPNFEDLNILFLPFGEDTFIPYNQEEDEFGQACKIRHEEITHYFFKDLSKPVYTEDIYSQYELEYLFDQVRESSQCGKENHIYLYYSNENKFSSFLQILDMTYITKKEKFIFLFDSNKFLYPINFKEKYGIDYSKFTPKEVKPEEITKLIYHQQYSSHNGGDFFNEIFDAHPYLCSSGSRIYEDYINLYERYRKIEPNSEITVNFMSDKSFKIDKKKNHKSEVDCASYFIKSILLNSNIRNHGSYASSRIIPAAFVQPHFGNITSSYNFLDANTLVYSNNEHEEISNSILFRNFKYIKTFAPIRRPTRSYGATIKFFHNEFFNKSRDKKVFANEMINVLENKNYLYNPTNRFYNDCRLVKFEDGKLYPNEIFPKLARFLDVPYSKSMKYCSEYGNINPESLEGNDIGFSTAAINRTYDEYIGENEGYILEILQKDWYDYYNYSYEYYDNSKATSQDLINKCDDFNVFYTMIKEYNNRKHNLDSTDKLILCFDKIYKGLPDDKTWGDTLVGCYRKEIINYISTIYEKNINYINKDLNFLRKIKLIEK